MLVLMANGTGRPQISAKIRLYRYLGVTLCTNDHLNIPFIEYLHGSAAHAAGNDDLYTLVRKKVRKKAGFVPGIWDDGFVLNLSAFRFIDIEIFTVAEVRPNLLSITCNSKFHFECLLILIQYLFKNIIEPFSFKQLNHSFIAASS